MDKSEVIILSSDDESDSRQSKKCIPDVTVRPVSKKSDKILKARFSDKMLQKDINWKNSRRTPSKKARISHKGPKNQCQNMSKNNPEVVDLVDCSDKSPNALDSFHQDSGSHGGTNHVQNHLKLDVIDIDTTEGDSNKCGVNKINNDIGAEKPQKLQDSQTINVESDQKPVTCKVTSICDEPGEISEVPVSENQNTMTVDMANKDFRSLKPFTELVEFCGSLETNTNDRIRLTKKLMKSYGGADSSYIESQEFRDLIQKCKEKVNRRNLYLVAKEINAELSFRKQIKVISLVDENSQRNSENTEGVQEKDDKKLKKQAKFVKKILRKLDKLGSKIQELEVEEVDLSDEEGSSYIRLQRYRERFCQIYKKLCKYTNEIPNIDHLYNGRICFAESKYPKINKCIEVWLNKIKPNFPDFTDIMKLLESQSSSLDLPKNRESLRTIAVEIFQQVGAMLQRRRKYDLWDSFCGFLGDQIDPAVSDPVLEKVLKEHFETRIKKEQEIFQHYLELQEKEKLEPEEVPEEEANRSPVESGNEDEKEIEEIENNILRRLDLAIKEDTRKEGSHKKYFDSKENLSDSMDEAEQERTEETRSAERKQSKNNYKNCKSLKWRSANLGKLKSESDSSEDSAAESEHLKEKMAEAGKEDSSVSNGAREERGKNDFGLEFLAEKANEDIVSEREVEGETETAGECKTPLKRTSNSSLKCVGKKICINYWKSEENENQLSKSNESFDVRYCQVFADSVFENLSEKKKDGKKRKVFRDMTNINRLMEMHGKSRNISGLFTPSFFHPVFREFEKPLWRRRFKVSFRMVGSRDEKCALSQEEKTGKSMKSDAGRESDKKDIQNNSERGGVSENNSGRHGFFSGHGGESHEDDDEDRNRKNGRTGNDISENKAEEEEEDEDDRDENEAETKTEATEHSNSNDKTEEMRATNEKTEWPSKVRNSNATSDSLIFKNPLRKEKKKGKAQKKITNKNGKTKILEKKEDMEILEVKDETEILEEKEETEKTEKSREAQQKHRKSKREFFKDKSNGKDQDGKKNSLKLKNGKKLTKKESNAMVRVNPKAEITAEEVVEIESLSAIGSTVPKHQSKRLSQEADKKIENESRNEKRTHDNEGRAGTARKPLQLQYLLGKVHKKNAPSASDEERVKRFLMHSPSSISITPPRKLTFSKPPSEAALQAIATLRNLKGISATIVRGKPKNEDDVMVIGGSYKRHGDQPSNSGKRSRDDIPVISNVQSMCTTPQIVTVEGNVSGFENYSQELTSNEKSECDSSSIKISNVWGSLPNNFMQSMQGDASEMPGCSSQNSQESNFQPRNVGKKKSGKKKVEYVVLE